MRYCILFIYSRYIKVLSQLLKLKMIFWMLTSCFSLAKGCYGMICLLKKAFWCFPGWRFYEFIPYSLYCIIINIHMFMYIYVLLSYFALSIFYNKLSYLFVTFPCLFVWNNRTLCHFVNFEFTDCNVFVNMTTCHIQ